MGKTVRILFAVGKSIVASLVAGVAAAFMFSSSDDKFISAGDGSVGPAFWTFAAVAMVTFPIAL